MQIISMPITGPNNLGGRLLESLEYFMYHYTANPGKNAGVDNHHSYANRTGFKAADGKVYTDSRCIAKFVYGCAQYYVTDKKIGQFIDAKHQAPHCGAAPEKYTAFIKKAIPQVAKGASPNAYIVGAEVCINPESDIYQALENMAWLAAKVLREAGKGPERFIRHYDVTGKWCPAMSINEAVWKEAKEDLKDIYKTDTAWVPYIPFSEVKARVEFYHKNPKAEPVASAKSPLRAANKTAAPAKPAMKLMGNKEVQVLLNKLKITDDANKPLSTDGSLGPKSVQAIKKLETKLKMKVDGKWDLDLQAAAIALLSKK